jgi:ADP-ribose pyrophosphatase YjhB (NUDIX family)
MKYCSVCGEQVRVGVPSGDNRPRHICDACGTVHYQNPKVVAGCIASWEDRILLCRRAIEPRHGLWTVPAGFMENGETTYQAALRETLEEANARVAVDDLFVTVNLPHINQIYMLFRGRLLDTAFSPGEESLEVGLITEHEVPWGQMAFPTVSEALKLYFADRTRGAFAVHMLDIVRDADGRGRYSVRVIS